MNLAALVGDDESALELAGILSVDAEIGLQRHFAIDARRDVDERAAAPHSGVECRKLVVSRGDD